MKTPTTPFLSASHLLALLVCVSCFAVGCRQQAATPVATTPSATTPSATHSINQPQEINEPPPSPPTVTDDSGDTLATPNNNNQTIAIAGGPSFEKPSSPQASNSNDQMADTSDSHTNDNDTSNDDGGGDTESADNGNTEEEEKEEEPTEPTIDIPAHWKQLSKTQEIWIDHKNKQVIVGGKICLDAGPLEMLICPRGTKEHETIVSVNAESWQVHAALLAVGAQQGVPSRWVPEYTPAWGPKIDIQMMWRDEKTNKVKTIDGKQWILDNETQKPMTHELVFGGSYEEPQMEGGRKRYLADAGELICLANFSTSTIDLRIDDQDTDLFFEANTPLIPPINTQIYTIIKPGPVIGKPVP